jgi:hypothetical protein
MLFHILSVTEASFCICHVIYAAENIQKVIEIPEATSLDWKSQCLENPSVPLLRLADKKSRIYRV